MQPDWHLVGRDREAAAIIDRLGEGLGTVIVGAAGIGKSALAREVQARLRAQGQSTVFVAGGDWGSAALAATTPEVLASSAALVIDDAHLLDANSAQLLSRLLAAEPTPVVATARSGERPSASLGWLWTAGATERLELDPLGGDETRRLLEQHLRGELDNELADVLADRTRGNPLLMQELVRAGVESGALARQRGTWRQVGALPMTAAVLDAIRTNLAHLDDEQLQTMQMIALAQPIRLPVAERLTALSALEALESRRLVALQTDGTETFLSCAHPLYGEILRRDLGLLRSRRLRERLLAAISIDASVSDRERMLAVSWRLDLNLSIELDELLACARIATTTNPALAERLLRTVLEHPADPLIPGYGAVIVDAAAMLAHLLLLQGRIAEADQQLDRIERACEPFGSARPSGEQRERLASIRVLLRTRLGEMTAALQLTAAAPDAAPDEPATLQTQVMYAQLMLLSARLDEALRFTQPLLGAPIEDQLILGTAAYTVVAAQSFTGRTEDTEQAMRDALPILSAARDQVPYGIAIAQVSTAIAQTFAGHFTAAARLGRYMHETAQHTHDEWLRPRSATVLGLLALYRGQADDAAVHLREAVAALGPIDAMFVRYNLAFLARAAAQAGNLTEAQHALQPPAEAPVFPLYEADWQIAEAAVLAAQYHLTDAAEHAMTAAHTAANHGQWGIAAIAAHDAARYADHPEAGRFLTTITDLIDGPLPPLLREDALARTSGDPARLTRVSVDFELLGATLFAAEAAFAAAQTLHRTGDPPAASRQATRASELHSRCQQAFIPWAIGRAAHDLTTRERQVALLAAAGHPDRHISTQLGISTRTVQTHLTHVYTKLDVASRADLAGALTTPEPADTKQPRTRTAQSHAGSDPASITGQRLDWP